RDTRVESDDRGARSEVLAALETFRSWTDRDALCVTEIEVVEAIGEPGDGPRQLGSYEGRRIEVVRDQPQIGRTVVHELCHAVDRAEGLSDDPTIEHPYDPAASDFALRDEESRRQEAFAKTCEHGPLLLDLADGLAARCAPEVDATAVRFVRDTLYPNGPRLAPDPVPLERSAMGEYVASERWHPFAPIPVTFDGVHLVAPFTDGYMTTLFR